MFFSKAQIRSHLLLMDSCRPKISIVTVCFNILKAGRRDVFKQMLDSVAGQSYRNIEHIIVDGASTDGTIDFIKSLISGQENVVFHSEPDTGIYDAMNRGARLATGEYIAYVNTDDYYHDLEGIERVASALNASGADYSYGKIQVQEEDESIPPFGVVPTIADFLVAIPFGHLSFFLKKSVFEHEGGFDDQNFDLCADHDLIMRILLRGYRGVDFGKSFATFRKGGASSDNASTSRERILCMKKNFGQSWGYSSRRWERLSRRILRTGRCPVWLSARMLHRLPVDLRRIVVRSIYTRFFHFLKSTRKRFLSIKLGSSPRIVFLGRRIDLLSLRRSLFSIKLGSKARVLLFGVQLWGR